jgi:four helix bundle protein
MAVVNQSFKNLTVYKKAFGLAMEIFEVTKFFPPEERYSLTDQIRRCSRAVATCVAEAYRKRNYPAYFTSKSSDADMENSEIQVWLEFALKCKYIKEDQYNSFLDKSEEVGRLLSHMIENPKKYLKQSQKIEAV